MDIENVAVRVEQHCGRRVLAQQQLLNLGLQVFFHGSVTNLVYGGQRHIGDPCGKVAGHAPGIGIEPTVDAAGAGQRRKQFVKAPRSIGAAQYQQGVGPEGVMEKWYQLALQARRKINQQVAAAQDIELGEWWIGDHVLVRENNGAAQVLADAVTALVGRGEVTTQTFGRDIPGNGRTKQSLAGAIDGVAIDVGGKDLQREARGRPQAFEHFVEHDCQRIGFLSGGTGGHPGLERGPFRVLLDQAWQRVFAKVIPHRRIAEKAGHADQQFLEQQFHFNRVVRHPAHVVGQGGALAQLHAPIDATHDGTEFVVSEVGTGLLEQQLDHLLQGRALVAGLHRQRAGAGAEIAPATTPIGHLCRHLARQRHDIDCLRRDRTCRHGIVARRRRQLRHGQATRIAQCRQTDGAVGACAGQGNTHGRLPRVTGQGTKKTVDRMAAGSRAVGWLHGKTMTVEAAVATGRRYVHAVGLHRHAMGQLRHRHAGDALQQLRQDGRQRRRMVLYNDVSEPAGRGHTGEEFADRIEAAGRGADANYRHTDSMNPHRHAPVHAAWRSLGVGDVTGWGHVEIRKRCRCGEKAYLAIRL